MEEGIDGSLEYSRLEQWAVSITYSCNALFEGASVTLSFLPNIISHQGAL
jgi:hypothetical protein